jgi:uncharacterized RDD family membrane protein YckC
MTQPPEENPQVAQPAYTPPAAPPYVPMAAGQGFHLDPASGLELPDGVELASIGRRIGAYFLAIALAIVTLGIGYVIWGLVLWGRGTTPALKVLGMQCWRPDTKQVPGFWRMVLRDVVGRIAEGILSIITLLVSFILFVTGKERKSLHDIIGGTVVLYDPQGTLRSR